jgi:hypothetical protein
MDPVALSKGYFTRFFNSPSRRSSKGKLDLGRMEKLFDGRRRKRARAKIIAKKEPVSLDSKL